MGGGHLQGPGCQGDCHSLADSKPHGLPLTFNHQTREEAPSHSGSITVLNLLGWRVEAGPDSPNQCHPGLASSGGASHTLQRVGFNILPLVVMRAFSHLQPGYSAVLKSRPLFPRWLTYAGLEGEFNYSFTYSAHIFFHSSSKTFKDFRKNLFYSLPIQLAECQSSRREEGLASCLTHPVSLLLISHAGSKLESPC